MVPEKGGQSRDGLSCRPGTAGQTWRARSKDFQSSVQLMGGSARAAKQQMWGAVRVRDPQTYSLLLSFLPHPLLPLPLPSPSLPLLPPPPPSPSPSSPSLSPSPLCTRTLSSRASKPQCPVIRLEMWWPSQGHSLCLILPNQSERGCSQREQEVGEQYVLLGDPEVGPQPPDSSGGLGPGPSHPAYTHSAVRSLASPRWKCTGHFQQRSGMQLRLPGQRGEGESPVQIPHIPRVAQETG